MVKIYKVLDEYFPEGHIRWYDLPDLINNGNYLRYTVNGTIVILSVGSNEGEIDLFLCSTAEELENKIRQIIY